MSQLELETIEKKKRGGRQAKPRIACTICEKPAVRYVDRKRGKVEYEHRDEPPIKEFVYRGHKMRRYRRCYAGTIAKNGLEGIVQRLTMQPRQPQEQQQKLIKKPPRARKIVQQPQDAKSSSLADIRKSLETVLIRLKNQEKNDGKPFIRIAYTRKP